MMAEENVTPAKIMTLDFTKAGARMHSSGRVRDLGLEGDRRPMSADGKLLTAKQIRARARRRVEKNRPNKAVMSDLEFEAIYKPIDEWDLEELARGRPRNKDGNFKGAKPKWITAEVYERAMERFRVAIKTEMGAMSPTALDTLQWILGNEDSDARGRPAIPPSVKLQASTFLLEHVVGKPKQHVESEISVKLQGILGAVMVNPNEALAPADQGGSGAYQVAHLPGHTIPLDAPEVQGEIEHSDDDLDWE